MILDEYILTKVLGRGTFGDVLLTKKKGTNISYATKRIDRELPENSQYCKYFVNEVSILKNIHHNNIVKVEDLKKTKNHYYIIMELCNGGSLKENLDKYKQKYNKPFSEKIVQHIMRQIINAVNYLHGIKIVHRDLKLANLLVNYDNEIDKNNINLLKSNIKLVDFGFATHISNANLLKTVIGSPFNMDPRILKKFCNKANEFQEYDEKADIWSLGTLCYKMLVGENPFSGKDVHELSLKVEEGNFKIPLSFSKETISFLLGMLQYEPSKRLSAKELVIHPFLIKSIRDFSYIDLRHTSNKIKYKDKDLYINIKNSETISSIVNIVNNRTSTENGDKYSLSGVQMANSTPMPISTITTNNIDNLKRKEKYLKNKILEMQIPNNEKSILNSLIEINEKALSKYAQQTIINENQQQIQPINNNHKNHYTEDSSYPEIQNKINLKSNKQINIIPQNKEFSSSNKNLTQIPIYNRISNNYFTQIPIYHNSNKELYRINTNIDKESFKYYHNQNQM